MGGLCREPDPVDDTDGIRMDMAADADLDMRDLWEGVDVGVLEVEEM